MKGQISWRAVTARIDVSARAGKHPVDLDVRWAVFLIQERKHREL